MPRKENKEYSIEDMFRTVEVPKGFVYDEIDRKICITVESSAKDVDVVLNDVLHAMVSVFSDSNAVRIDVIPEGHMRTLTIESVVVV